MANTPARVWWQSKGLGWFVTGYYAFVLKGCEHRSRQDQRIIAGYATMFPVILVMTAIMLPMFMMHNMGNRPIAFISLAGVMTYALTPFLAKRAFVLADIFVLFLVTVQSGARSFLLGAETGFQYHAVFVVYVIFMIIGFRYKWRLLAYSIYAAAFMTFCTLSFQEPSSLFAHVPPETLSGFSQINLLGAALAALLLGLLILRRAEGAENALDAEHQRSEKLLQNLLPNEIAQRLKTDATQVIADNVEDATVLFADIVGFTPRASRMPADQVVKFLNEIFQEFDALTSKHGLEKIKTIGDAYMVVGGLSASSPNHAQAMTNLARDMQTAIAKLVDDRGEKISLRIGIHSGAVVAGVIGKSKVFYDVWGETVNIASRLENNAAVDQILVTQSFATRIEGAFVSQPVGPKSLQGIGVFDTYEVLAEK